MDLTNDQKEAMELFIKEMIEDAKACDNEIITIKTNRDMSGINLGDIEVLPYD